MYGDQYRIAPLSVVLDPLRGRQVLGLDKGKVFSRKVVYIFEKQMEEADILVINKCDLINDAQQDELQAALENRLSNSRFSAQWPGMNGIDAGYNFCKPPTCRVISRWKSITTSTPRGSALGLAEHFSRARRVGIRRQ